MRIVSKDTEKILIEEVKKYWDECPTQRCLHLEFSRLGMKREKWLRTLSESLKLCFEEAAIVIYICHDDDIFIFNRNMTNKLIGELLTHLRPKLEPAQIDGLASLFEIRLAWSNIIGICEEKIEKLNKKDKPKVEDEQLKKEKKKALKTFNKDLVETLSKRRQEREEPEVMIVEDDPLTQRLVFNALKGTYSHSIENNGQDALTNYILKAPDIIFLDIGLPDISGHKVLEKLFQIDPEAYVIMFSGNGDKDNVLKAVNLGAKGFVGKPFTRDKLIKYIEKSPLLRAKKAIK